MTSGEKTNFYSSIFINTDSEGYKKFGGDPKDIAKEESSKYNTIDFAKIPEPGEYDILDPDTWKYAKPGEKIIIPSLCAFMSIKQRRDANIQEEKDKKKRAVSQRPGKKDEKKIKPKATP